MKEDELRRKLPSFTKEQIQELSAEQLSDCLFFFRKSDTADIDHQLEAVTNAFLKKGSFDECCYAFNTSEFHHVPQPSSKAMDIFIRSERYWELLCLLRGYRLDGSFYFPSEDNIVTLWKTGKKLAIWFSLMYGPNYYTWSLPVDIKRQLVTIGIPPLTEEESDFLDFFTDGEGMEEEVFNQLIGKE